MQQIIATIALLFLLISTFVPLAMYQTNRNESSLIKQNLNLATKAVVVSLEDTKKNYSELSHGYYMDEKKIDAFDHERLLEEFDSILQNNCNQEYEKIKQSIKVKVLCYHDRFYITANKLNPGAIEPYTIDDFTAGEWLPPYFYNTVVKEKSSGKNKLVNLSTISNTAWYSDDSGIIEQPLTSFRKENSDLTEEVKNDLIIEKINKVIAQNTFKYDTAQITVGDPYYHNPGLSINILNPSKLKKSFSGVDLATNQKSINEFAEYRQTYSDFNVLEGITFFVVYSDDKRFDSTDKEFRYHNYNVAGHTFLPHNQEGRN